MLPESNPAHGVPRVNVLGVGICAIDMETAVAQISSWIENQEQHYVTVTGVHGVMESQRDGRLKGIHNRAGLVTPDGMPLVWLGRLQYPAMRRVYGPDLMLALCEHSLKKGYRHFFYGGREGVPELLAERLSARFPGLRVAGTFSPPFRPVSAAEDASIVERIDRCDPDIVWVGLSTPKQEDWMCAHVGRVKAPVLIGVGAAFDFLAGLKPQAPSWIRGYGLEWLFRLLSEPRRLWRRYLRNNPTFIFLVILQLTGLRKYRLDKRDSDGASLVRLDLTE